MKTFKCVKRFKDGNKIVGYRIADAHGNTRDVSADKLKSVINSGEALIVNLTLTADGRLRLKDIPTEGNQTSGNTSQISQPQANQPQGNQPQANQPQANQPKIVSFESAKVYKGAGTMLEKMLQAFNETPELKQIRITECEFGDDDNEEYALFVVQRELDEFEERSLFDIIRKRKYKDIEYEVIKNKKAGQLILRTHLNEYFVEDMESCEWTIKTDLEDLINNENLGYEKVRKLGNAQVASMRAQQEISKSFNMRKTPDANIFVAGNNVVYLRSMSDTAIVEIPDYVTVVSNGAFDFNHNLKQLKCPIHLFRTIGKMVDAKNVTIEKIGRE